MKLKEKDFVEVEYTGKLKEEGAVFDTTDEKIAKDNNIHNEDNTYGPVIVCIGQNQVLEGLDKNLIGKETGKEYTIELSPEEAFGKKNPKLIQLVPTSKFMKQKIQPMPGLQVNIDGMIAMIKTVSGGRSMVDFNHPLSGKDVVYNLKINKVIMDDSDKLKAYFKISLALKEINMELKEGTAKVTLKNDIPKEAKEKLNEKVVELIPNVKKVEFVTKQ
ncbi:MAG: peptidylprolyl isomerase [Nanoarchaeota archaeon]